MTASLTTHMLLLSKSLALQQQRLRAVVVSSCSQDVLHHQCETIRINHPSSLHYHYSNDLNRQYSSTIYEGHVVQPPLNNDNLSLLQWQQQRHLYTHYEKLTNNNNNHHCNFLSTLPNSNDSDSSDSDSDSDNHESTNNNNNNNINIINHPQHTRLSTLRNVGIFAHVDAGKTTVTERMLALSGIVHDPGSVDTGDTVTDYLPAERERGITIQSAAVKFDWIVPPPPVLKAASTFSKSTRERSSAEQPTTKKVSINLIDTPGHVDFSVEVHRSVAVLDGAVLVVDAVAGVQAQTETVWRAIRNTDSSSSSSSSLSTTNDSSNNENKKKKSTVMHGSHAHEPLPTIMYINKMDRIGSDYNYAISTVLQKLGGSNPLVVQLPLYQIIEGSSSGSDSSSDDNAVNIVVGTLEDSQPPNGNFVGVLDIVNMRTIVYPNNIEELSMEEAVPIVTSLLSSSSNTTSSDTCSHSKKLMEVAINARRELISNLANVDEIMEDLYLLATLEQDDGGGSEEENIEDYITTDEIQASIRRMTLQRKVMPTLCGAALRGVGVEPLLDCVAEYCKFSASYVCVCQWKCMILLLFSFMI